MVAGAVSPALRLLTYLCDVVVHDLLVGHIALVAHKELVDALGGVAVDLLQPLLDVVEAVHVGNIVDDTNAVSATVVRAGNCAETLLACCVPLYKRSLSVSCASCCVCGLGMTVCTHDLEFYGLAIKLDGPDLEVHADCRDVALSVGVVCETEEKA